VDERRVPVLVAESVKEDPRAVARPRRRVVLVVAARQLRLRPAAVDRDDEDLLAAVTGPPDAVQLVKDAAEPPRVALLLVLLLIGVVAHARGERDARRVG